MDKKDDFYRSIRTEYLRGISAGWSEEERKLYIDEDGTVLWGQTYDIAHQLRLDTEAILNEYRSLGKQPDNTPQDAVSSLISTADEMLKNKNEDKKFLIQTKNL